MKASKTWLKDYLDISLSTKDIVHKLTMSGLEVEKVETVAGETVFEMEITPNRPDCLNIVGVARELSAIINKTLKFPKISKASIPKRRCAIDIKDEEGCPRYIGTVIEGVAVKQSPRWLKKRIEALGIRSINNIVDITNFCLMELGQPMHAFDYDKIKNRKIVVRRAKKGERIDMIDDKERELNTETIVIADDSGPVAVAGVMGGKDTEVTEETENILLESAYFDPISIRRAARALGVMTDSSYRFERGVDIDMVETAAFRATALILSTAGGTITHRTDAYPKKKNRKKKTISVSIEDVCDLLGAKISLSRSISILKKLDFSISRRGKKNLVVSPPSFRNDVLAKEDVIEEIARIIGYDNLPMSLPAIKACTVEDPKRTAKERLRIALQSQGLNEVITYSLISNSSLNDAEIKNISVVAVQNPLSQDQEIMRPSMVPSMLSVARNNYNRGQRNLSLFEIGKVYTPGDERTTIGIVLTGSKKHDWRDVQRSPYDFFDLKGIVSTIAETSRIENIRFEAHDIPCFLSGQSSMVLCGREKIGILGAVDNEIAQRWGINQKIFVAEIDFEKIYSHQKPQPAFASPSEYPSTVRDVSILVKRGVEYEGVEKIARSLGKDILAGIQFVEEYVGEKVPTGYRGLVFSLTYQSPERTLRDEEVNDVHDEICQEIMSQLDASRR